MIKHIVSWKLKEDINKQAVKENIKQQLEELPKIIPEIVALEVQIDLESTSTHDLLLLSTFRSMDDLSKYANHPAHKKVAEEYIKPYVQNRFCADYMF